MNTPTRHGRGWGWGAATLAISIITALAALAPAPAQARTFINQGLNLPGNTAELGLGVGIGHRDAIDYTGLGLNLEFGYGLRSDIELRFRTGLRFGDEGKITQADYFGRPVESETAFYNLGFDTLANPELGLRFNLTRRGTAEIAFDARAYLPVDGDFGLMLGLPVALHFSTLRLDTGLFIPFTFDDDDDDNYNYFSIPLHLWIRLSEGSFFGPMTGIRFHDGGGESVPLGIGAGTSLAYDADLRFWFLFPDISEDAGAKNFGLGLGLYVTF